MKKNALLFAVAFIFCFSSVCISSDQPSVDAQTQKELALMTAELLGGVDTIAKDLSTAAEKISQLDWKSDAASAIMSDLCSNHSAYAIDCGLFNEQGVMVSVRPNKYKKYLGMNVKSQAQVQKIFLEKKPRISEIFKALENVSAISFDWPIFKDEKLEGFVGMLIKPNKFVPDLIRGTTHWGSNQGWVLESDGTFLYNRDSSLNGKNIFTDPYNQKFVALVEFGKKITLEANGTGTFRYRGAGQSDPGLKQCTWTTISPYGATWRVAIVQNLN